ncbi:hypothetical protein AURDEDRAFT_83726 [Auricularia subglabra TFB-10046 SS5]|nr:hypothetical protein AURDEDRAFT_83726 [Auricularia subglabra TFB-10046 SS5]
MLVRVSYTKVEGLFVFDESVARIQKDMQPEDWAEFMVVWRKNRLELYEEYSTPGKEWLVGHKDLSFVVPLHHSNTHLSLYSATDMSFAITCTPRPVRMLTRRRAIFASRKTGTNVFVFKSKSRSRAVDWIWKLWRELGGEIPDFIDIRAPTLGTRIRMDIPDIDDPDARPSIDDIIDLCRSSFRALPEWQFLIDDAVKRGQRLALCWRTDTKLDWVWLPTDVEDQERPWAVWYGVALRQAAASNSLEIRLAQHFPTKLVLRDGKVLMEPPAIEGYLHYVRPNGNRARTYLASHDGNIFSLPFARANPPPPPAPPIIVDGGPRCAVSPASEVRRGAEQMLAAEGFLDVRSIVHVRRAETPQVAQVRMKRSFELCLRSGQVMRFEANSRADTLEWIARLNALVAYWTQRHRIDARNEMDLVQATGGRPRFVLPRDRRHNVPEVTPDPDDASPYLGVFWHWCVLEGCRAIIKAGRLFMKHGLKGQYEYSNVVLVSGHLIQFHIAPRNSEHHPRGDTINLLDAYVCSGLFAMQALPRREFLVPLAPKRYQDGLEADDAEEDVTFMLWYHRYPSNGGDREGLAPTSTAPKLNAKRSILVLKARSKLERDAWCWALNCELERIVRSNQLREKRVREIGGLIS